MISATSGIMLCLNDIGLPYLGMFFLMFCGLCDAFDGKVARTKKNRTEQMKQFGIQIDSLSDLVAFGVLPACIGIAMLRSSIEFSIFPNFKFLHLDDKSAIIKVILNNIDVLLDGKFILRLASEKIHYVGSINQCIIDVKKSLKENKKILYIDNSELES